MEQLFPGYELSQTHPPSDWVIAVCFLLWGGFLCAWAGFVFWFTGKWIKEKRTDSPNP